MQDIVAMDLLALRSHEALVNANVRLGGYHMDQNSPPADFRLFRASLDSLDWLRLYLLGEFAKHTWGKTARVVDAPFELLSEDSKARITSFFEVRPDLNRLSLDLRNLPHLAPVVVTTDIALGSLTIIDGNHRAIAQCWQHGPTAGVPIIVCVHNNISQWPYIAHHARER